MSGDFGTRGFAFAYARYKCGISLEFAVDAETRSHFACQLGRFHYFVYDFVFRRTFGGEAQHSYLRVDSGHGFGCAGGTNGNLSQLSCIGYRGDGYVAHNQNAVLSVVGSFSEQQHCSGNAGDARGCLDDLQGRTQYVAGRVTCAGQLSVGIAGLNHQATVEQGILHFLVGFFYRHAFFLTQFEKQLGIFFFFRAGSRVYDSSLGYVSQSPFFCRFFYF